jgi:hypothetical protein
MAFFEKNTRLLKGKQDHILYKLLIEGGRQLWWGVGAERNKTKG